MKMSASKDSEQPLEPGQTPTPRSSEEAHGSVDDSPSGSTSDTLAVPTHASIPPVVPSVHSMIGMHVSHSIRQKIIEGQYIDLVCLLPPRPGGEEKKLMINNLGEIISRDANPKKVDTIEQWTDLMFIFAGVYLSGHPAKAIELLKYIQSVRMGASRGAVWWKEYDVQYRLRKAQYPASSWGEVDSELWLMYMTPTASHNALQAQHSQKPTSVGKCYDFNFKGSCDKYPCPYTHSCLRCSGQHTMLHCTLPQSNAAPNFRAPSRFTAQPNNNAHRAQQPQFRGPQNANNQRPRFKFTNPQAMGPR